jgi:hypothetical protein
LSEKKALLEKLRLEVSEEAIRNIEGNELSFVESLLEKGLLSEIPDRNPDDEIRRKFSRINIKGEPISKTIIEERG